MAECTYTYDPTKIPDGGKDRMRFELGDTMVEGRSDTTALTDQEIESALAMFPKKWKRAKLALLESICRRFAYEVNTTEGPVSLSLLDRAKLWREDYEALKKEVEDEDIDVPPYGPPSERGKPPYFYGGMMSNHRVVSGGGRYD